MISLSLWIHIPKIKCIFLLLMSTVVLLTQSCNSKLHLTLSCLPFFPPTSVTLFFVFPSQQYGSFNSFLSLFPLLLPKSSLQYFPIIYLLERLHNAHLYKCVQIQVDLHDCIVGHHLYSCSMFSQEKKKTHFVCKMEKIVQKWYNIFWIGWIETNQYE